MYQECRQTHACTIEFANLNVLKLHMHRRGAEAIPDDEKSSNDHVLACAQHATTGSLLIVLVFTNAADSDYSNQSQTDEELYMHLDFGSSPEYAPCYVHVTQPRTRLPCRSSSYIVIAVATT